MDKEVDSVVLAMMNEKRLKEAKRYPAELLTKLGVSEVNKKANDTAWLAAGDTVVVAIWAEFVHVTHDGHWICIESQDAQRRFDGGRRSAAQAQRGEDRLRLLKHARDAGKPLKAVLQTNRVTASEIDSAKGAAISMRVIDDAAWYQVSPDLDRSVTMLVREDRQFVPTMEDIQAAMGRSGLRSKASPEMPPEEATEANLQAAAIDYLTRHFAGYGYNVESVTAKSLGYDLEVADRKGTALLRLAVRGIGPGTPHLQLSSDERASAERDKLWRLAVVTDALWPGAQHKLYKPSELPSVPGFTSS